MKKLFLLFMLLFCASFTLFAFGKKEKPLPPPDEPVAEVVEEAPPVVEEPPPVSEPIEQLGAVVIAGGSMFYSDGVFTTTDSLPYQGYQPPALPAVPTIAVLPFTGVTNGDGEALALLFSNSPRLRTTYNVVPLTRNVQQRLRNEQQSGALSNQPQVDLILVGIVRNIRNNNVMLVNIVQRATRQLIAGDFRIYRDPSELQSLIPAMVDYMIESAQKNRAQLKKLAVTPFDTPQPGVSAGEAEMLALLLSAEIASSAQYAVLPRMDPLLQAIEQVSLNNPSMQQETTIGGAELMLTGSVITLGTKNLFVAQISRVADGAVEHGAEESYETSSDGILQVIPRLSSVLTGIQSRRVIPPNSSAGLLLQQPSASSGGYSLQREQPYIPSGGDYRPTTVIPQGNAANTQQSQGSYTTTTPSNTTQGIYSAPQYTTTQPAQAPTQSPPPSSSQAQNYYNPLQPQR